MNKLNKSKDVLIAEVLILFVLSLFTDGIIQVLLQIFILVVCFLCLAVLK